jgi:hypothetical protein
VVAAVVDTAVEEVSAVGVVDSVALAGAVPVEVALAEVGK